MLSLCPTSYSLYAKNCQSFYSCCLFPSSADISSLEVCSLSFIYFLSVLSILLLNFSSLNSSNRSYFPSANSAQLPHSLCSRAQWLDSHLSMSVWLPSQNPSLCHSPRQRRPPVSSLCRHEEKLARGSDNPLTPHLSSARGKAPS